MNLTSNVSLQCLEVDGVLFWSLNCYGVTISELIINFIILIIGCLIIFLNSIVVWAGLSRSDSEEVTDILIVSLALADVTYGVFIIYQTAYNVGNWQIFAECTFRLGILVSASLSSILHIACLSIDCYIKITRPYFYQIQIKKRLVVCISTILWILSFVYGFLPMMGWNPGQNADPEAVCGFYIVLTPDYRLVLWFLYWIPFFKNIILYGHIYRIARRHAQTIGQHQGTGPSKKTLKFTKTVFLIVGLYFLCWMPIGIYLMLEYCHLLDYMSAIEKGTMMVYLSSVGYLNSLVNPVIYAVKISYIRRKFVIVFRKVPCFPCLKRVTPEESCITDFQDRSTIVRQAQQTEVSEIR